MLNQNHSKGRTVSLTQYLSMPFRLFNHNKNLNSYLLCNRSPLLHQSYHKKESPKRDWILRSVTPVSSECLPPTQTWTSHHRIEINQELTAAWIEDGPNDNYLHLTIWNAKTGEEWNHWRRYTCRGRASSSND